MFLLQVFFGRRIDDGRELRVFRERLITRSDDGDDGRNYGIDSLMLLKLAQPNRLELHAPNAINQGRCSMLLKLAQCCSMLLKHILNDDRTR